MPLPVPLAPEVTVNHAGVFVDAVQLQELPFAVTPTVPLPATALGDALVASSVKVHGAPACVTANVWPAIVSVPVRGVVVGLAANE